MSADARAVIERLRELDARSGGRRVAWGEIWREERDRLSGWLAGAAEDAQATRDPAGNLWWRLPGESPETVIIGSHLDCVPDGGWLDGCLGLFAAAEVFAQQAHRGRPRRTLALVDWADEEGAISGHSLLGSSAACGLLDVEAARGLSGLLETLAENGVRLEDMPQAREQLRDAVAYLELHIEQGPVLDEAQRPSSAVDGCLGVRRTGFTFTGQAGHAGATPMALRRDPLQAAAAFVRAVRERAEAADALATVGTLHTEPPTPTAIPARVELVLDLRHRELGALEAFPAGELAERAAAAEGCTVESSPVWSIDPVRFDPDLVARATQLAGEPLTSGPLHDAAAVARAGIPTVMIFARTLGGISHSREEDAREEDLFVAIDAYADLVEDLVT